MRVAADTLIPVDPCTSTRVSCFGVRIQPASMSRSTPNNADAHAFSALGNEHYPKRSFLEQNMEGQLFCRSPFGEPRMGAVFIRRAPNNSAS